MMKWQVKINDEMTGENKWWNDGWNTTDYSTSETTGEMTGENKWWNDGWNTTDQLTGENKWWRTGEVSNHFSNGV